MNTATLKKYAINAAFIVGVVIVVNTIIKRVPTYGPKLGNLINNGL